MPLSYFVIYDPQKWAKDYPYSAATPSPECLNAIREGDWVATEAEFLDRQRLKCNSDPHETLWFEVLSVSSDSWQGRMKVPRNWSDADIDVVIELAKSHIVDVRFADFGRQKLAQLPVDKYPHWCLFNAGESSLKALRSKPVAVQYLRLDQPKFSNEMGDRRDSGWRITTHRRPINKEDIRKGHVHYVPLCFVLDMDDSWLHLIGKPTGAAFERSAQTGQFMQVAAMGWSATRDLPEDDWNRFLKKTVHRVARSEIMRPCQAISSEVRSSVGIGSNEKTEKHPSPQRTSEIETNNANGLSCPPSLRELAEVAEAARARWLSSPSNVKLLAKIAELPSFSIPQTPPGGWPKSWEPVSDEQARLACLFGNRSVLARYFRETEKVNLKIILLFVYRLDPRLASVQAARYEIRSRKRGRANPPCVLDLSLLDIADLLDPGPDQEWEIRFVRRKGNTQKELQWRTFLRMEVARLTGVKIEATVEDILQETKRSRAQVFRDHKAFMEYWEGLKSVLEELGDDEAKALQRTACAVDDLLNHAAIANRLLTDLENRLESECAPDA